MEEKPFLFSVDLEDWLTCRWATGSHNSLWPDIPTCINNNFSGERPINNLDEPVEWILEQLSANNAKGTFFCLAGENVIYAHLIKKIVAEGHEIACHALFHKDMSDYKKEEYLSELKQARKILQDISQQPIDGFRAPNLVVTDWFTECLLKTGFKYDSSVCPAFSFKGKYEGMSKCSQYPYRIGDSITEQGYSSFWEIPIQTFPVLQLPATSGIMTRIAGYYWILFAMKYWSRRGATGYYLHPYELNTDKLPQDITAYVKFFMKNRKKLRRHVCKILKTFGPSITMSKYIREKEV